MSRIGKLPINIPKGVKVEVSESNFITVKGKLGELSRQIQKSIKVDSDDGVLNVTRATDSKEDRAFHGLNRALINNMVVGVSVGFEKKLEVIGVGYRATVKGNLLELNVGFSHPIVIVFPNEITVEVQQEKRKNAFITIKGIDKQLVGQVAAKVRSLRKPEPFKGKGIKYIDEYIRRKAGKAAAE